MIGVGYSINDGVGCLVSGGLDTSFGGDSFVITLGIDNCLRGLMMSCLKLFQYKSNMLSMIVLVDVFLVGYTYILTEMCASGWLGADFDGDVLEYYLVLIKY